MQLLTINIEGLENLVNLCRENKVKIYWLVRCGNVCFVRVKTETKGITICFGNTGGVNPFNFA